MDQQLPTAPRVSLALALKYSTNMKTFCVIEKQHWSPQVAKLSCDTRPKVFSKGSICKACSDLLSAAANGAKATARCHVPRRCHICHHKQLMLLALSTQLNPSFICKSKCKSITKMMDESFPPPNFNKNLVKSS